MTDEIFVKPGAGRRVRRPDGVLLRDIGERVERNSFWLRRLADDDVVETNAAAIAKAEAAAAKAAEGAAEGGEKAK